MISSENIQNGKTEFKVILDEAGTSPNIQTAIWKAQHTCVTDNPEDYFDSGFDPDIIKLSDDECGEAIIKHQLKVEHFGVLNAAFISFKCYGFPHSVVQQATRHRDSAFLVTSMRYTGEKFIRVANGNLDVDKAFYVRSEGVYVDRNGNRCIWTEEQRDNRYQDCLDACKIYKHNVENLNMPYEMAREFLPFCYRQPFDMFGTVEAFWHFLDQRTKKDSELEIRILADSCFRVFEEIAPELAEWYGENRYGKARLAP